MTPGASGSGSRRVRMKCLSRGQDTTPSGGVQQLGVRQVPARG
jgi:hypothetical protein